MRLKAHPTVYGDTAYRSRLEATWAAFFDLSGIRFSYEPIDLEGWVPDFMLFADAPIYAEVKPAPLKKCDCGNQWLLSADNNDFEKAKRHSSDVFVLLLGVEPQDDADFFGIGVLLDPPTGSDKKWADIATAIRVENAKQRWAAAKTLTQWHADEARALQ